MDVSIQKKLLHHMYIAFAGHVFIQFSLLLPVMSPLGHKACSWTRVGVEELELGGSKGRMHVSQDLNQLFISMSQEEGAELQLASPPIPNNSAKVGCTPCYSLSMSSQFMC